MKHMFGCARMEKDEESHKASQKQRLCSLVLLVLIILTSGLFLIFSKTEKTADRIIITLDGEVYNTLSLDKAAVITIEDGKGGFNIIQVENGAVSVSEANCSNQTCVHTGSVSRSGEIIACLPHRLVISIESKDEEVDAIAY